MGAAVLFVGGTRSGKSGLAQRWAEAQAPQRLYLATGRADDEEMAARIARHRQERGQGWHCLEEPLDPAGALASQMSAAQPDGKGPGVVLFDCVSLWVATLMAADMTEKDILTVCRHAPQAQVIVVHMEAFDHCLLSRNQLRLDLAAAGVNALVPNDGDIITLD